MFPNVGQAWASVASLKQLGSRLRDLKTCCGHVMGDRHGHHSIVQSTESPIRFMAITTSMIATPGKSETHQWVVLKLAPKAATRTNAIKMWWRYLTVPCPFSIKSTEVNRGA